MLAHRRLTSLECSLAQDHFQRHAQAGKSTRAIVFSNFRDSVMEIVSELNPVHGVVARYFVGQVGGWVGGADREKPVACAWVIWLTCAPCHTS